MCILLHTLCWCSYSNLFCLHVFTFYEAYLAAENFFLTAWILSWNILCCAVLEGKFFLKAWTRMHSSNLFAYRNIWQYHYCHKKMKNCIDLDEVRQFKIMCVPRFILNSWSLFSLMTQLCLLEACDINTWSSYPLWHLQRRRGDCSFYLCGCCGCFCSGLEMFGPLVSLSSRSEVSQGLKFKPLIPGGQGSGAEAAVVVGCLQ